MCVIAFCSQTITLGCMWGTFAVLLTAVEARLGVGRDLSSLAVALVLIGSTLLAPVVGIVAARISLRLLMMIGAGASIAGYAALAAGHSLTTYHDAYGLLVGPGMCLCGMVLPSVLVTRWFTVGRGRALGVVHLPIMVMILPLVGVHVLRSQGLPAVYAMLAGLMALALLPMAFIIDSPPRERHSKTDRVVEGATVEGSPPGRGLLMGELAREPQFWVLVSAMAAILSGQIMFGAHLVPIARQWGADEAAAAGLLSLTSLAAMVGTLALGWVADRIGGRTALLLACLDSLVLWSILLGNPPFWLAAAVVALIGLHGAAALPLFGMAVSERFGQASFERAFGLGTFAIFPFMVTAVPLAAAIFMHTGSYRGALLAHTVFFVLAALLLLIRRGPVEA